MSYARFSETSSVYVYADVGGYVACCGCILGDEWECHSAQEVVAHMREHEAAGHQVPVHLFDEELYPPEDFVAMCSIHLCREQTGHSGEHTAINAKVWGAQGERIRAAQIGSSHV